VRQRRREFYEYMSERLAKPLYCRGEACSGYVYVWARAWLDYEADYFEPRFCKCPLGQHQAKKVERNQYHQHLAQQAARAKALHQNRLVQSGLPLAGSGPLGDLTLASYWWQTPGHPNRREPHYREIVRWVGYWPNRWPKAIRRGYPFGLVLAGRYGRGKTGLAVAAGRYLVEKHGLQVYYTVVKDFLRQVSRAWDYHDGSHHALIERMEQADLLILDDLGAGHRSVRSDQEGENSPLAYLYDILDYRYRQARPLLITTNCPDVASLERVVEERNLQRIMDSCRFIEVTGDNLRSGIE
jgi:DNA replication protein DnaC